MKATGVATGTEQEQVNVGSPVVASTPSTKVHPSAVHKLVSVFL
jgi:hypothetical protein